MLPPLEYIIRKLYKQRECCNTTSRLIFFFNNSSNSYRQLFIHRKTETTTFNTCFLAKNQLSILHKYALKRISERFDWTGFSPILFFTRPFSLPILLSVARLLLSMFFQNVDWIWEEAMQGASLLLVVKNCFKQVVRSCNRERTFTALGSEQLFLTASAEYGATSACTLKAIFFQDSHWDACSKKYFMVVSTLWQIDISERDKQISLKQCEIRPFRCYGF